MVVADKYEKVNKSVCVCVFGCVRVCAHAGITVMCAECDDCHLLRMGDREFTRGELFFLQATKDVRPLRGGG